MNRMIKRLLQSVTLILLIASAAAAQFTQMQIPKPSGFVNDFAGKLSPQTKQALENLLTNFRDKAGIEVTLVTVPFESLNGYPIEDYTLELGRRWGVGKSSKEPAAVLVVAIKSPNDQGVYSGGTRLEISRHLEGDVPDGLAGELIRKMRGDFQKGNFDNALFAGVQTIVATIAEKRGISMEGIDTNAAYRPRPRPTSRGISLSTIIFLVIAFFILMAILGRFGGRGGGGGRRRGSDWWVGPMIWSGGGGGWGGSGSSSSDSGGGWGGFGGGGDFGGGGASDSW